MLDTLSGVRVLDFGVYFAGPYSSRLLADLGADVIKIEAPAGDPMRHGPRTFAAANRNKRSITLDLKLAEGKAMALELAARCDVVCHNLRPGVSERLGMGYESVRAVNPEVIYLHAPGWGSTGPMAARQGFAPWFSAFVGIQTETGGEGNPPLMPYGNEDHANGLLGSGAVIMALWRRRRTGRGAFIETPQLSATMVMASHMVRRADGTMLGTSGLDREQLGVAPGDRLYRTSDGWIAVKVEGDAELALLLSVVAEPTGESLDSARGLETGFSTHTSADAAKILDGLGIANEVPAGPDAGDRFLVDGEQMSVGRVEQSPSTEFGLVNELATLVRLSRAVSRPGRTAPRLGEHTAEVLAEIGCDQAEIERLRAAGVVAL